jgi:hypothetical protein
MGLCQQAQSYPLLMVTSEVKSEEASGDVTQDRQHMLQPGIEAPTISTLRSLQTVFYNFLPKDRKSCQLLTSRQPTLYTHPGFLLLFPSGEKKKLRETGSDILNIQQSACT